MKHFLLSLLVFLGVSGFGQVNVTILPTNLTACYGSNANFQAMGVPDTGRYVFTWKRNGVIIPAPDTVGSLINIKNISYTDTGYYTCIISSQFNTVHSDTAHLHISIKLNIFPGSGTFCYGSNASFQAMLIPDTGNYVVTWMKNGEVIQNPDTTGIKIRINAISYSDTGYYTFSASSQFFTCQSDRVFLHLTPKLNIDTLYRFNELDCPGTCKGKMKALVSGGIPPYFFDWGGGHSQDSIVFGLCKGKYTLKVTDSDNSHCVSREYTVDVIKLPRVTFKMDPPDTVYLTKPYLTVSIPDTSLNKLSNWVWTIEDTLRVSRDSTVVSNVNPLQHQFMRTGRFLVKLKYLFNYAPCSDSITDSIMVRPVELKIPNVFTPNNDGKNDYFVIQVKNRPELDINEVYLSTELVIINRWGKKVYQSDNYKSKDKEYGWDGKGLADGVYFYVLKCHGLYDDAVYKGSITIVR